MRCSILSRTRGAVVVLIVVGFGILPAQAQYSAGLGMADDPYQIATAADLILLGESPDDYDKHFILTADVDLDPNLPGGRAFDRAVIAPDTDDMASGFQGTAFTGAFDGNGHTIAHLKIEGWNYVGLFGKLDPGAIISNLGLQAVDVEGTGYVGGLAGWNEGSIVASSSSGVVCRGWSVGGLVGYNRGRITASHSRSAVTGQGHIGGLVGSNWDGSIVTSCSAGAVRGDWRIGGLVGSNRGSIATSYSTAAVQGDWRAGGLVGCNRDGSIAVSYSTGRVSGDEEVGGLVGAGSSLFAVDCFWDTETSGQTVSAGGAGKTTAEMQTAGTFLEAGWDFTDETENGTDDIWKMSDGLDYPDLWWEKYGGGMGEPNDPYLIYTPEHLNALGAEPNDYDKHFKLMADIDLSGYVYGRAPIAPDTNDAEDASQGTPFGGVFDGNGHMVSHLTVEGASYLGLFGDVAPEAMVSRLGLEAADVNGTGQYCGGLAGRSEGTIAMCYSTGVVAGDAAVGGLVGENCGGSVNASFSTGIVSGTTWVVGGLVGQNWQGSITACYSGGAVGSHGYVGGLAGINLGEIAMSYSTAAVTGEEDVGGLVGRNWFYIFGQEVSGRTTASFWDMETSGQPGSDAGDGRITAEMETAGTFLEAGWDFVDETANGAEDIWWILEDQDYPRLWWEAAGQ